MGAVLTDVPPPFTERVEHGGVDTPEPRAVIVAPSDALSVAVPNHEGQPAAVIGVRERSDRREWSAYCVAVLNPPGAAVEKQVHDVSAGGAEAKLRYGVVIATHASVDNQAGSIPVARDVARATTPPTELDRADPIVTRLDPSVDHGHRAPVPLGDERQPPPGGVESETPLEERIERIAESVVDHHVP